MPTDPVRPPLFDALRWILSSPPAGPLNYQVYWNAGTGGAVDTTTPLATTALTVYTTAPLAHPGDYTFLVRTYDPVAGLGERNTVATWRLILDASGADVTNRPSLPPQGLTARPLPGGKARARWRYPSVAGPSPQGFRVYLNTDPVPIGVVPYHGGYVEYSTAASAAFGVAGCDPSGLFDGVTYTIKVAAYNASGEGPSASYAFTASSSGPSAPSAAAPPLVS